MPDADAITAAYHRDRTVDARRAARFRAARERIAKIVDGSPPLTDEQLHQLALLLTGGQPVPVGANSDRNGSSPGSEPT